MTQPMFELWLQLAKVNVLCMKSSSHQKRVTPIHSAPAWTAKRSQLFETIQS